uniref:Uncharacterized protein n=1 Tax=Panagrolaimus sp. JU765 TaxID=591449 RepID=A0AC34QH05_9BILA
MSKPPKNKIFIPRKGSRTTASVSKQGTNPQEVGERAVDFIQAVKKTDNPKARSAQFEQMVQWSRVCFESVIANREAKDRVKEIKLGAKQHIKATTPSNKLDVTKE